MAAKFNGEPSIAWSENCSRVEWGSHRSKFKRKECLCKHWKMCENGGKLVLKWLFSRLYTGWTLRMIMLGPRTCGQCLVCWEEDGEKQEWRPGPHHHHPLVSTADWATTTVYSGETAFHICSKTQPSQAARRYQRWRSYFDGGITYWNEDNWEVIRKNVHL